MRFQSRFVSLSLSTCVCVRARAIIGTRIEWAVHASWPLAGAFPQHVKYALFSVCQVLGRLHKFCFNLSKDKKVAILEFTQAEEHILIVKMCIHLFKTPEWMNKSILVPAG